jgi:hypothetical protein
MGTFTCSLRVAQDMHQLGVPVWLVRRPVGISKNMNVGSEVYLRDPDLHCVKTIFAGTIRVHHGPPTAVRNRVCQALRIESIRIDHSAYHGMKAGDDFAPVAGLMPGSLLSNLRHFFFCLRIFIRDCGSSFRASCGSSDCPRSADFLPINCKA